VIGNAVHVMRIAPAIGFVLNTRDIIDRRCVFQAPAVLVQDVELWPGVGLPFQITVAKITARNAAAVASTCTVIG
jgi:hypothetical protein